ncbi:hypothetical protein TOTORO_03270 [Serratia phage vB_SmaS-Totoro]|nr:hypothetical protein TOTORO_03270 [Serratia phage vB_SmaS-Totoro]
MSKVKITLIEANEVRLIRIVESTEVTTWEDLIKEDRGLFYPEELEVLANSNSFSVMEGIRRGNLGDFLITGRHGTINIHVDVETPSKKDLEWVFVSICNNTHTIGEKSKTLAATPMYRGCIVDLHTVFKPFQLRALDVETKRYLNSVSKTSWEKLRTDSIQCVTDFNRFDLNVILTEYKKPL